MNRFMHPVVQVIPTRVVVVAEHLTRAGAIEDAALRDAQAEPGVWHHADEPDTARQHARTH